MRKFYFQERLIKLLINCIKLLPLKYFLSVFSGNPIIKHMLYLSPFSNECKFVLFWNRISFLLCSLKSTWNIFFFRRWASTKTFPPSLKVSFNLFLSLLSIFLMCFILLFTSFWTLVSPWKLHFILKISISRLFFCYLWLIATIFRLPFFRLLLW